MLLFSFKSYAEIYEAKPFRDLMQTIDSLTFSHVDTAMVFGFNSIKSCLHVNSEMLVIKNYCFPKRNYPAKGYTIISPKFGIVELYQEDLSETIQKRDVSYDVFSHDLRLNLKGELSSVRIVDINKLFELFYKKNPASCWSTNFSFYTEKPEYACNHKSVGVIGFAEWANETQVITGNAKQWKELINYMENKFID